VPLISILVTTYNRRELVKKALNSIFSQTFTDFEIIMIDDQSTDGTDAMIAKHYPDKRLKYIYNKENQAGVQGDRVHAKRFVNELACGKYWISLNSDDHWLSSTLLARQVALFEAYPDAAMVAGGQQSYFVSDDNLSFTSGLFPSFLNSDDFIDHFSKHPIESNIIAGATLYNRELFMHSGAFTCDAGRWEWGYEIHIAPCCYGSHIYIDEPCVRTEISPGNASFQESQLQHYLDSVASIKAGFRKPLLDFPKRGLKTMQRRTIQNIGKAYLANTAHAKEYGNLAYCSTENLSRLVTQEDVVQAEDGL
jgi:glycosyltransferase involved in cell wall biosynthesis